MLAEMPIERIKEVTRDRLRIKPLTEAGILTIQAILDSEDGLEYLPGIGETTASRILGAAQTLRQTTYDEMPVRIDIKNRTSETTELLRSLSRWDVMRRTAGATSDLALAEALTPLAAFAGQERQPASLSLPVLRSARRVPRSNGVDHPTRPPDCCDSEAPGLADPWDDFLQRPADYFAMLCRARLPDRRRAEDPR